MKNEAWEKSTRTIYVCSKHDKKENVKPGSETASQLLFFHNNGNCDTVTSLSDLAVTSPIFLFYSFIIEQIIVSIFIKYYNAFG